jgi:hypothetical protein
MSMMITWRMMIMMITWRMILMMMTMMVILILIRWGALRGAGRIRGQGIGGNPAAATEDMFWVLGDMPPGIWGTWDTGVAND